uniref:Uncharacterized protein n=2 Tax=Callorhinchus milii TaxID=7868 RepID=V9LH42_CALMI
MADRAGNMSLLELAQQVALLNWLSVDDELSRQLLSLVTRSRVADSVLRRLTGQDTIDLYKRECILSIAQYVKTHPGADQRALNREVEKQVLLFAARVQALK